MTLRTATCRCGRLSVACEGEPLRISVCHCLECQKRSGSAFAAQARFPADRVSISGEAQTWTVTNESGAATDFHFCGTCGANLYYRGGGFPELVAVAIGSFADPGFPAPTLSVWEQRKQPWVAIVGDAVEHFD